MILCDFPVKVLQTRENLNILFEIPSAILLLAQRCDASRFNVACYLSAFRLVLEVGGGADLGLYILQVRQGLIQNLQLPLG